MHSTRTETPLLVLPREVCLRLRSNGPTEEKLKELPISVDRCNHFMKYASVLEQLTARWSEEYSFFRVAEELRDLATPTSSHADQAANLTWLWNGREHDVPLPIQNTANEFFNVHPPMVWRLISKLKGRVDVAVS